MFTVYNRILNVIVKSDITEQEAIEYVQSKRDEGIDGLLELPTLDLIEWMKLTGRDRN